MTATVRKISVNKKAAHNASGLPLQEDTQASAEATKAPRRKIAATASIAQVQKPAPGNNAKAPRKRASVKDSAPIHTADLSRAATQPVAARDERSALLCKDNAAAGLSATADNTSASAADVEQFTAPGHAQLTDADDSAPTAAQLSTQASGERILLPARMELAVLDVAHQLLQRVYPPVHSRYILDGAQMSVIDMAGVQMLIIFIRSMTAYGCVVEWDNYSVQMYQLASELGVTSQLGD